MSDHPEPLVPAEVDLRDFGFMPLDVRTLLTSSLWIKAKKDPRVAHAAMSLWCECWHQVPAASLPDDDEVLADLARCDAKEWARVRERALLHFVLCSDGRLYHRHVAKKALESWDAKQAQRARTKAATEAREKKKRDAEAAAHAQRDEQRDDERHDPRNDERDEQRDVHQGTVKGQGQGQGLEDKPPAPREGRAGDNHPGTAEPSPYAAVCIALRAAGMQAVNPSHPVLRALVDAGAEPAEFVAAAARADGKDDPFAYVLAIVKGDRKRAAETAGVIHRGPLRVIGKQTAIEEANRRAGEEWLAQ